MTRVDVHHDSTHGNQPGPRHYPKPPAMSNVESRKIRAREFNQSTWFRAARMQRAVLRNATGSVAVAWIASACYSLGNIFSGKRLRDQSRHELIIANSAWASVTFCVVVFLPFLPLLLSLRFLDSPDEPPTLWNCVKKLVKAARASFIMAIVSVIACGHVAVYLLNKYPSMFEYKVDCYMDNFLLLGYFTEIARVVKKIYYEKTCQGRARLISKQQKSVLISARKRSSKINPYTSSSSTSRSHRNYNISFWRAYIRDAPFATPALLATAFVHILSRQRIINRGSDTIAGFIVGSIVFKLGVQELAKFYVLRKRVRSIRVMCILVGLPTVLIDTQARIILLGMNRAGIAAFGTLLMALVEIFLRVGKAKFVTWSIIRRERVLVRDTVSSTNSLNALDTHYMKSVTPARMDSSLSAAHIEFEMWRRQVQAFHTAELNADMYAEFIAIGCSASILFFYSSHPNYFLLRQEDNTKTEIDVTAWSLNQLVMLAFQLGVEIIVDYISIVLEMMAGIEFDHIENLGSFLAALFMVSAVINVMISIGVYLC